MVGSSPVRHAEMDRVLIVRGWRCRCCTDVFRVGRPLNDERVLSPYRLKELAIGSPRETERYTGRIRQAHFYGIRRRSLRLFGTWILQPVTARTHIPEIPADKVTLQGVVVEHWREGGVHVALRLSIAEPGSLRSGIRHGSLVQRLNRPGESRLWHMAETAGLVLMDGEMFIKEQQLSQSA
jgi:hypothetical protein